jgi:hypothetical protein
LRKIYPVVATVTDRGWQRLNDTEIAEIYTEIAEVNQR